MTTTTATLRTGVSTYTTPNDREVVVTRLVDAPRPIVYSAMTDVRHIPNWLTGPEGWTMPICEVDLRPGGRWRYVYRKSSGREMEISGVYREVVPNERVVATESWGPPWPESVNATVLIDVGTQTLITMTMTFESLAARDAALKTGMSSGVDKSFDNLDVLLRTLT